MYAFVAATAVIGMMAGLAVYVYVMSAAAVPTAALPITITVTPGSSAHTVADQLYNAGLIRHRGIFTIYARLRRLDTQMQAGTYRFEASANVRDILARFVSGDVAVVRVTIAEGLSAADVASLLANAGLGNEARFLSLMTGGMEAEAAGLSLPSLAGYLFPDTYSFALGTSEENIIRTMLRRFTELIVPLYELADTQLTLSEAVTLASIVEKEAYWPHERGLIASVYLNRLAQNMPLQSDPTVHYALGDGSSSLTWAALRTESPYNTYIHKGLPPGPISNPGFASLHAVLFPDETDYLFFTGQGDKRHYFSTTYEEHLAATDRYRK